MFILAFFIILASYLNYRVTRYVITNKRVLIKAGWIGADIRSVYYNQIRSAYVNVGIIGKIFGTGNILMDTGRIVSTGKNGTRTEFDTFAHIKTPYDILRLIQEHLLGREEGLSSGRTDYEQNTPAYKKDVQETEKMKREVK